MRLIELTCGKEDYNNRWVLRGVLVGFGIELARGRYVGWYICWWRHLGKEHTYYLDSLRNRLSRPELAITDDEQRDQIVRDRLLRIAALIVGVALIIVNLFL